MPDDCYSSVSRGGLSDSMLDTVRPLEVAWRGLGLTPTTYSAGALLPLAESLHRAYVPQIYWGFLTWPSAVVTRRGLHNTSHI
jgi:hypothetical protein